MAHAMGISAIHFKKLAAEKLVLEVFDVIPAQAGIQSLMAFLNSRIRGSDGGIVFIRNLPACSK
jgi:hypothetical protein